MRERLNARGCFLVRARPRRKHQSLNALPIVECAFLILVESGSIAVSFRHTLRRGFTSGSMYRTAQ